MQKNKLPAAYAARLAEYDLGELDLSGAVLLKFERGEWLLNEGHAMEYLYILLAGKAKVSVGVGSGRCLLLCYYISEGIIGDMELMTGRYEAISSMQAVTPLTCIGLPLETYAPVLRANLPFVLRVGAGLSEKLHASVRSCTATILSAVRSAALRVYSGVGAKRTLSRDADERFRPTGLQLPASFALPSAALYGRLAGQAKRRVLSARRGGA